MTTRNVEAEYKRAMRHIIAGKVIKENGFCYCPLCKENLGLEKAVIKMNYCCICGKRLKQ